MKWQVIPRSVLRKGFEHLSDKYFRKSVGAGSSSPTRTIPQRTWLRFWEIHFNRIMNLGICCFTWFLKGYTLWISLKISFLQPTLFPTIFCRVSASKAFTTHILAQAKQLFELQGILSTKSHILACFRVAYNSSAKSSYPSIANSGNSFQESRFSF